MLSDLHLGHTIGRDELKKWVALINAEEADYIFVSGDVIDNDVRPLYKENIDELLSEFRAKNGVYAILGNHEYIAGVENSLAFFEKTNWRLLRDEVVLLPENIYVVGRDDKMNPDRAELSTLLEGLDPDIPMIVLDHQPVNFPTLAKLGEFLQFSGHTHDGQVWPYNYAAKSINGVSSGLWDFSNSQLLISAGIGIWGGKFRIGTRSDYRVVTFCQ
ncbi:metallophosphoesterase [Ignatzschineria rhizosphaerae]|uniref:Metallophosphoesterase n=1 Tax=Ignatzschineria rhizosphaerae TaxID=2923279 RepID=A0ABY3X802_9GAMM|nr:metallophosphoesterase [Ignatzschineria rhizosphaerae]UNM96885.1 metallophosphoesterase [Ignatzschineria rhizosphaerae]